MTNRLRRSSGPPGTVLANAGQKTGPANFVSLRKLIAQYLGNAVSSTGITGTGGITVTPTGPNSVQIGNSNPPGMIAGQRGIRGRTGPPGQPGSPGATGATGPAGAPGASGTGTPGRRGARGDSHNRVPIIPADTNLQLADNVAGNVSTARHGLAPKLTGSATSYLDSSGNWSAPAGTIANASYSWIWQWNGTSTFTHSFACSGNLIKPQRNVTLYSTAVGLTTVTGGVYKIGVAPFDTVANKITSAPVYTAAFTESSGSANAWVVGNFGTGVALTGGSTYLIFVVRTDSTTTVSTTLQTVTTLAALTFPAFITSGLSATNQSMHLASLAPGTSDTWTSEGGWYLFDFSYGF